MKKKTPKPEGIPLSDLILYKGSESNYKMLMREKHGNPVLKNALTDELFLNARIGLKFSQGRTEGSISERTKHISQLVQDNPSLSAKELGKRADSRIIGNMSEGRFANAVSEARTALGLKKPKKITRRSQKK